MSHLPASRIRTVREYVADKKRHIETQSPSSFNEGYSAACRDILRWLDSWLRTGR